MPLERRKTAFHWMGFLRKLSSRGGCLMQISQSISTTPSGPDFLLHIVSRENPLGVRPLVVSKHQICHLYRFKTWTEFWPCHLTSCRFRSKLLNLAMLSFHLALTGLLWGLNEVLPVLCLGQCLGHGSSDYFLFRFIRGTYRHFLSVCWNPDCQKWDFTIRF